MLFVLSCKKIKLIETTGVCELKVPVSNKKMQLLWERHSYVVSDCSVTHNENGASASKQNFTK